MKTPDIPDVNATDRRVSLPGGTAHAGSWPAPFSLGQAPWPSFLCPLYVLYRVGVSTDALWACSTFVRARGSNGCSRIYLEMRRISSTNAYTIAHGYPPSARWGPSAAGSSTHRRSARTWGDAHHRARPVSGGSSGARVLDPVQPPRPAGEWDGGLVGAKTTDAGMISHALLV